MSDIDESARKSMMENIDRLRLLTKDWEIGGATGFAEEIRRFGEQHAADNYLDAHSRNEVRHIFDVIGDLLDDIESLGPSGVVDPNAEGDAQ